MRLLFTMGSGSASGHCNTMEKGPHSAQKPPGGKKKGRRTSKSGAKKTSTLSLTDSIRTESTLGAQETDFGRTTLGSRNYTETFEYNSLTYTQQVKKTFERNSGIYREFVQILSEVSEPSSDKVELVKRVIVLFDGHPELIRGFTYFLPPEITIEIQQDAVVVNVEEDENTESDEDLFSKEEDTDMTRYIRNIKWTYMHQPDIYERFSVILQGFNRKNISEMDAVTQIANLFEGQRDLVLGFNIFLPDGYKILDHEKKGFLVRHPCKKGMKAHYTPINITEEYVH